MLLLRLVLWTSWMQLTLCYQTISDFLSDIQSLHFKPCVSGNLLLSDIISASWVSAYRRADFIFACCWDICLWESLMWTWCKLRFKKCPHKCWFNNFCFSIPGATLWESQIRQYTEKKIQQDLVVPLKTFPIMDTCLVPLLRGIIKVQPLLQGHLLCLQCRALMQWVETVDLEKRRRKMTKMKS